MFEIMRQDGFYALVMGVLSHQSRKGAGFAFVDNTDLCVMHPSNQPEQVVNHMQQAVTNLEGLLRAMGGALVPEKCFWYFIDFKLNNNKWTYKKCNQVPGSISILDTDRQQVTIQRLETSEARRTLGFDWHWTVICKQK